MREEKRVFSHVGGGWHFEADEVARCIRDGKLESELWGHEKSLLIMDVFDEVRFNLLTHEKTTLIPYCRFVSRVIMCYLRV